MTPRQFICNIWRIIKSFWYFKILGRKRDRAKDRDCAYFEESHVNVLKFKKTDEDGKAFIDEYLYMNALHEKGKRFNWSRNCCGDGHYKCLECMKLDIRNTDLIT